VCTSTDGVRGSGIADSPVVGSTGLHYLRARYYDPELGRFLTRDPVCGSPNDPQSLNRYAYVGNNPVNLTDPTGLLEESAGGSSTSIGDTANCFLDCFCGGVGSADYAACGAYLVFTTAVCGLCLTGNPYLCPACLTLLTIGGAKAVYCALECDEPAEP